MIDLDQRELALMVAVEGNTSVEPLVKYLQVSEYILTNKFFKRNFSGEKCRRCNDSKRRSGLRFGR